MPFFPTGTAYTPKGFGFQPLGDVVRSVPVVQNPAKAPQTMNQAVPPVIPQMNRRVGRRVERQVDRPVQMNLPDFPMNQQEQQFQVDLSQMSREQLISLLMPVLQNMGFGGFARGGLYG